MLKRYFSSSVRSSKKRMCTRSSFHPWVVSPLSVAENKGSGKKRLILDLSELNHYVEKRKVKFEDWNTVKHFFKQIVLCLNSI